MAFSSQPLHRYQEKHRRNVPLGRQSPLPNVRHLQMNPQVTPMEVLLRKSQLCATKQIHQSPPSPDCHSGSEHCFYMACPSIPRMTGLA